MNGISAAIVIAFFTMAITVAVDIYLSRKAANVFGICGICLFIAALICLPINAKIGDSVIKDGIIITTVYEDYLFGYKEVSAQWVYYDDKWYLYSPKNPLSESEKYIIERLDNNLGRVKQLNKVDKLLKQTN